MSAVVLQFPVKDDKPNCWDCVHHASSPSQSLCTYFDEVLLDEAEAAADCPKFEEV